MGPEGYLVLACKRRDCEVCGPRRARVLARVLLLDARVEQPTHCLTLTTSDPSTSSSTFRDGTHDVFRRLRRRYGRVDYLACIEFTTGRAATSGGHRRIHSHSLLKFRDRAPELVDVVEVEGLVRETWRQATGAYVVEVAALVSAGAAIAYLGLHHRKRSQAPPPGWRGMLERPSQGYYHRPVAELRELARRQLRAEAIEWANGYPAGLAELQVELERGQWEAHHARVVRVREARANGVVEPLGAFR